jgi:hypothetical protein
MLFYINKNMDKQSIYELNFEKIHILNKLLNINSDKIKEIQQ